MKTQKENVKVIADRIYSFDVQQITIDLVQDKVEDLLSEENQTPDDIGSLRYEVDILLEVFNPKFERDISILTELRAALDEWSSAANFVNKTLGLDPNN